MPYETGPGTEPGTFGFVDECHYHWANCPTGVHLVANFPRQLPFFYPIMCRGVGRGGSEGSDAPPFLGPNFIHFLYKVLGQRSVQKQPF